MIMPIAETTAGSRQPADLPASAPRSSAPSAAIPKSAVCGLQSAVSPDAPANVAELMAALEITKQGVQKNARNGHYGAPIREGVHIYQLGNFRHAEDREKVIARRESLRRRSAVVALEEAYAPDGRCPWGILDLTDKERRSAELRKELVLWVEQTSRERGLDIKTAVGKAYWFAVENADCKFRELLATGKAKGNQIRYWNVTEWAAKWNKYRRSPGDESQWWSLADRYCHGTQARSGDERYWNHIALLYEQINGMSLTDARAAAVRVGEKEGWPGEAPSYKQVKYWYRHKADRAAVNARRRGEKYIYNTLDLSARRIWPEGIGNIWCSDHHEFNVFVRVPALWAPGYWTAVRPWITQFLDVPSMHEVASIIRAREGDGDVILDTWRRAVEQLGWSAETVYFDNGKDYRSIGGKTVRLKPLDESRCTTTGQILGVRALFAMPFNARAKPCEMDFGLWVSKFEKSWDTFCGENAERFKLIWQVLKRERLATYDGESNPLKGCLINPDLVPTLEHFTAEYYRWRTEIREKATSDGIMLNGKSPAQAWQAGLLTCARPKIDPETRFVAFLRAFSKPCQVGKGGTVFLKRGESQRDWIRYHSPELLPFLISGEEVLVKVDVNDVRQAYVFRWIEDHGWKLINCGGLHGGAPSIADIPAGTGMEQVRDLARYQRSRRKLYRQADRQQAQDEVFANLHRHELPTANPGEAALILGAGNLRQQMDAQVETRKANRRAVDDLESLTTDENNQDYLVGRAVNSEPSVP